VLVYDLQSWFVCSAGGGVMVLSIKFVPVLYAMIELDLKLIVTCGTDRENISPGFIRVQHDPEMDSEHLTEERSEEEKRSWSRVNTSPPPLRLRNFMKFERVTDIHFKASHDGDDLKLLIENSNHGFRYAARLIEMTNECRLEGHGYEVLFAVLNAALEDKSLDEEALIFKERPKRRIALYLEHPLAEELAARSPFDFDRLQNGDVLFAAREVRT
jgi:hypothetical protein